MHVVRPHIKYCTLEPRNVADGIKSQRSQYCLPMPIVVRTRTPEPYRPYSVPDSQTEFDEDLQ